MTNSIFSRKARQNSTSNTDSSILIKASPKMHSNYLEYFFEGDSLHMALQPDYCLVMAF